MKKKYSFCCVVGPSALGCWFSGIARRYMRQGGGPLAQILMFFVYFPGHPPRMVCLLYIRGILNNEVRAHLFGQQADPLLPLAGAGGSRRAGAAESASAVSPLHQSLHAASRTLLATRYTLPSSVYCFCPTYTVLAYCAGRTPHSAPSRVESVAALYQTRLVSSDMPFCLGVSSDTPPRSQ